MRRRGRQPRAIMHEPKRPTPTETLPSSWDCSKLLFAVTVFTGFYFDVERIGMLRRQLDFYQGADEAAKDSPHKQAGNHLDDC